MRVDDGRAVPNFIRQALTGADMTMFGDGSQTRSFGYITDLVDGIYRLMKSDIRDPVNIGNPREMPLVEMAEIILKAADSRSRIVHQDLPEDDPKVRQPDITVARGKLDWSPKVEVEEGIKRTVEWFRDGGTGVQW
jgi:dTDP-glucose 4,6-dehydratase